MNSKSDIFLSVVIPSYNEATNFKSGCLNDILPYLEQQKYHYELIFSDDGSTDETISLLKSFISKNQPKLKYGTITLLANKHGGKTSAVKNGVKHAKGEWRLFTDFDQSTHIKEIEKLLPYTDKGYDIIFGSRKINPKTVEAKWYREFIGNTFNLIVRKITDLKIKDTQCGFKLFSKKGADLFDKLYVYDPKRVSETGAFTGAFDVELFVIAKVQNLKVKEVPIRWQHHDTNRVNIVKDSARMFSDVIKIRRAKRKDLYK
ncbi:glycosyltransferase [Candidatus Saccharibacteria bacterium]|nr:glycosyltransferase [Candidatus Saccharibacteria bacterium]